MGKRQEKQRSDCVLENYYDLTIVTKSKPVKAALEHIVRLCDSAKPMHVHSILITTCTFDQTINYDRIYKC